MHSSRSEITLVGTYRNGQRDGQQDGQQDGQRDGQRLTSVMAIAVMLLIMLLNGSSLFAQKTHLRMKPSDSHGSLRPRPSQKLYHLE